MFLVAVADWHTQCRAVCIYMCVCVFVTVFCIWFLFFLMGMLIVCLNTTLTSHKLICRLSFNEQSVPPGMYSLALLMLWLFCLLSHFWLVLFVCFSPVGFQPLLWQQRTLCSAFVIWLLSFHLVRHTHLEQRRESVCMHSLTGFLICHVYVWSAWLLVPRLLLITNCWNTHTCLGLRA